MINAFLVLIRCNVIQLKVSWYKLNPVMYTVTINVTTGKVIIEKYWRQLVTFTNFLRHSLPDITMYTVFTDIPTSHINYSALVLYVVPSLICRDMQLAELPDSP